MSELVGDMQNPLWTERYRPQKIADVVISSQIKKIFVAMRDKGELPNMLLCGPPGIGKTSIAMAALAELGADVYKLNGSMEVNMDIMRNKIVDFASTVSFAGGRKYIFFDEADYLHHQVQPPLRGVIEEYSKNAGFIFTANYPERIIEPIRSRCSTINFEIPANEVLRLKSEFFKRTCRILENENVKFDQGVLAQVVENFFPDMRKTLNELQQYSNSGPIDSGILTIIKDAPIEELVQHMRKKQYTQVRKWVAENLHIGSTAIFRRLYDSARAIVVPESVPLLVIFIGKYQYQLSFCADPEINMTACLAEVMANCQFLP